LYGVQRFHGNAAACHLRGVGAWPRALAVPKPKWLFAVDQHWNWWLTLAVIATLMSVAAPLKIWNNTRIENESREASAIAAQGADWTRFRARSIRISF